MDAEIMPRNQDGEPGDYAPRVAMLCYTSRPIPGLESCRLRRILNRARAVNALAGITGCMIYDGNSILQVLEGDPQAVQAMFERIEQDPRHEGVRVIWQGMAHRREFGGSPMVCYNLAWRRLHEMHEARRAFETLLAQDDAGLTDIVSLARMYRFLRVPAWMESVAA